MAIEYSRHPEQWWQDEEIHKWFKKEKKKLSAKAKEMFEKKHGKKKKDKKERDSDS